jgi:DNA-binding response OmpR family regulator
VGAFVFLGAIHAIRVPVIGLACGADDYLTKPFHAEELVARWKLGRRDNSLGPPGMPSILGRDDRLGPVVGGLFLAFPAILPVPRQVSRLQRHP